MNKLKRYFDLLSGAREQRATSLHGEADGKKLHWLPQYFFLIFGITIQPFMVNYQNNKAWNLDGFGGWLIFAIIISVIIFPAVYKSAFDPEKPLFVQLCAIFASGIGWESLLNTGINAANLG